jgi:hypothetical protein
MWIKRDHKQSPTNLHDDEAHAAWQLNRAKQSRLRSGPGHGGGRACTAVVSARIGILGSHRWQQSGPPCRVGVPTAKDANLCSAACAAGGTGTHPLCPFLHQPPPGAWLCELCPRDQPEGNQLTRRSQARRDSRDRFHHPATAQTGSIRDTIRIGRAHRRRAASNLHQLHPGPGTKQGESASRSSSTPAGLAALRGGSPSPVSASA